ncbi:MAG: virulence-associated E family protein [Treponema sp.]|nr:virulence-associated E family protein [Treponema sp.]
MNNELNEKIEVFVKTMIKEGFYKYKPLKGTSVMFDGETSWSYLEYVKTRQFITGYKRDGAPKYLDLNIIDMNRTDFPLVTKTIYDINRPFGKVKDEPILNTAKPLSVKFPIEGFNNSQDTLIFWKHLEYLCGDVSDDIKEWVKDWLCDIIQDPNNKKGTALIFIGSQGCGKSIFFDKLMFALLGEYFHYDNGKEYSEKFNLNLKDKLLVNFDEGFATKSKSSEAKLKSFITQPNMKLEGKGTNSTIIINPARAVFTTNSGYAMNTAGDDRRFAVFNTVKKDFITPEYFDRFLQAVENTELLQKFMYELKTRTITSRLNIPPVTEAKEAQKTYSASKIAEWFDFIITTKSDYEIPLKDNSQSSYNFTGRLWDENTENQKVMFKENAFASFSSFQGKNDYIDSTNKLFSALREYLSNKEWTISNETKRITGFGFTYGNNNIQRVWVLKK